MKTITIKASDEFAQMLVDMATSLHVSKSEIIRQAVEGFRKQYAEDLLKKRMQESALKVRNKSEIDDWDDTLADGLEEL